MKVSNTIALCSLAGMSVVEGFSSTSSIQNKISTRNKELYFFGGGSASKEDLDEQWERQQEMLKFRNSGADERDKYFQSVEDRRAKATKDQVDKWAWQKKQYKKGEDPIDEWRKRRESGQISDLDNQYGDPKKIGGIPLPMASFGVGGEFGVGGKFDNGGRFDLRLPYAEQGWVDEEDEGNGGNPFANIFGGGKKAIAEEKKRQAKKEDTPKEEPKKNGFQWPF